MPQQLVSDLDLAQQQRSNAAKSAAETLVRVLGGTRTYICVPLVFDGGGDAAQLGKSGAASEDVELSPVVVLAKKGREKELLVPAGALLRAKEIAEPLAARQFFESALGVVIGTQLLRVVSVEWEEIGGEAFLYRVQCAL
jgi:hypothetical protein